MKSQRRKINKKENEFSKVNFPELRKTRKYIKEYGEESFLNIMKSSYERMIEYYNDDDERMFQLQDMYMMCLLSDADTSIYNYYIESNELLNFFKDTKIKKEIIPHIINSTEMLTVYNSKYEKYFNLDVEVNGRKMNHYIGCIHAKNIERSFYFMVQSFEGANIATMMILNGSKISCRCPIREDVVDEVNQKEYEIARIVLNMLFYMDAFPDKILDSPPAECIDKLNCNNSKTITMSDEIRDYLHENRDVSPHLRRGHFRYLASDFYKNKKGQTIFVKSSFVKGQAKTIIE